MAIVLFTVFLFGCTTEVALNAFQIEMNVDEDKYMEENRTAAKMDFINKFEKKFIYPRILRDHPSSNSSTRYNQTELQNVSAVRAQHLMGIPEQGRRTYRSRRSYRSVSPSRSIHPSRANSNMSPPPYNFDRVDSRRRRRKKRSLYDYGYSLRNIGNCGINIDTATNDYTEQW